MLHHIVIWLKKLRRLFSRPEWVVRLLALTRSSQTATKPGLILVQIDGLSRSQFKDALEAGRVPFLHKRMQNGYQLLSHYSGLPSSTPAVQGELLYGVRCAVPAFGFRDHETGKAASLFEPSEATRVEQRLEQAGSGLLHDGSAYSDIYTGEASMANFCTTNMGLGNIFRESTPFALLLTMVLYSFMWLRILALIVVEFGLAVIDFFRGMTTHKDLLKELTFIPSRVGISVLLRELITVGVMIDAARGLPVIHCNFLGYDEQSHRRGPSSAFAHWTLKGIDNCLKRIWRTARRSACREYEIWVYSDHGQEEVEPYQWRHGESIKTAAARVLTQFGVKEIETLTQPVTVQLRRFNLLGGKLVQRVFGYRPSVSEPPPQLDLVAKGPVGHLYLEEEALEPEKRRQLGQALAQDAHVPVVMAVNEHDEVIAWTREGQFRLPQATEQVVGKDHPFLEELKQDLIELARHPDAGTFVFFSTGTEGMPMSFPIEHGAHGGFGREETHGFLLLPEETAGINHSKPYWRPQDIRRAALQFLQRAPAEQSAAPVRLKQHDHALRVMTYNVHSCRGLDGEWAPDRVAAIIAQYDPDVVALQEVDVQRPRSRHVDQAQQIAQILNMHYHFHPSYTLEEEQYGNVLLSRYPIHVVKSGALPGRRRLEPRSAIWGQIEYGEQSIQLVATHLGLRPGERLQQVRTLLGAEWLGDGQCQHPIIFCGDFNTFASSKVYREITRQFHDAQAVYDKPVFGLTWMSLIRLDYIFMTPGIQVQQLFVPRTTLTRKASDHLPLIADLVL